MKTTFGTSAIVANLASSSFPRKRESSLSNNLRVADKAMFEALSQFVMAFVNRLDSRFRGNDGCYMVSVMNYVMINKLGPFNHWKNYSFHTKCFTPKKEHSITIAMYAGFLSWRVRHSGFTTLSAFDISPAAN
jgi:hypothetical protein